MEALQFHLTLSCDGQNEAFPCRSVVLGLGEKALIGRSTRRNDPKLTPSQHNAMFNSPVISRKHAEITVLENLVTLKDLGSMHGTYLNGIRLPQYVPKALASGDTVMIGKTFDQGDMTARTLKVVYSWEAYVDSSKRNGSLLTSSSRTKPQGMTLGGSGIPSPQSPFGGRKITVPVNSDSEESGESEKDCQVISQRSKNASFANNGAAVIVLDATETASTPVSKGRDVVIGSSQTNPFVVEDEAAPAHYKTIGNGSTQDSHKKPDDIPAPPEPFMYITDEDDLPEDVLMELRQTNIAMPTKIKDQTSKAAKINHSVNLLTPERDTFTSKSMIVTPSSKSLQSMQKSPELRQKLDSTFSKVTCATVEQGKNYGQQDQALNKEEKRHSSPDSVSSHHSSGCAYESDGYHSEIQARLNSDSDSSSSSEGYSSPSHARGEEEQDQDSLYDGNSSMSSSSDKSDGLSWISEDVMPNEVRTADSLQPEGAVGTDDQFYTAPQKQNDPAYDTLSAEYSSVAHGNQTRTSPLRAVTTSEIKPASTDPAEGMGRAENPYKQPIAYEFLRQPDYDPYQLASKRKTPDVGWRREQMYPSPYYNPYADYTNAAGSFNFAYPPHYPPPPISPAHFPPLPNPGHYTGHPSYNWCGTSSDPTRRDWADTVAQTSYPVPVVGPKDAPLLPHSPYPPVKHSLPPPGDEVSEENEKRGKKRKASETPIATPVAEVKLVMPTVPATTQSLADDKTSAEPLETELPTPADESRAPKRVKTEEAEASTSSTKAFVLGTLVGGVGILGALIGLPESFF